MEDSKTTHVADRRLFIGGSEYWLHAFSNGIRQSLGARGGMILRRTAKSGGYVEEFDANCVRGGCGVA